MERSYTRRVRLSVPLATAACLLTIAACGGDAGDGGPSAAAPAEAQAAARAGRPTTVATGLDTPWDMAFLPDRSALITERGGRVRLLSRTRRLRSAPVARIPVAVEEGCEGGLLGVAVDPDFRSNRFVYLYRTVAAGNEVVRYRYSRGRLAEDGRVFGGIESGCFHNGGRIRFGPDGLLYASTGDAEERARAQDPDSLNGKILRTREFRGREARPEVFTSGHRNVQGLDWEPRTRRPLATEFGESDDDEVNALVAGRNYGWPNVTGTDTGGGRYEPALRSFGSDNIAPSGAAFVTRRGSAWTGSFLVGTLRGEQVRRISFDRDGSVRRDARMFRGTYGRIRSIVSGPDGAVYLLTSNRDGRGTPRRGDDRLLRIVPPRG